MSKLILTLNSGSSSIKFAAFAIGDEGLQLKASGQIEGLGAHATFSAKLASGEKRQFDIDESRGQVDHSMGLSVILEWLDDTHHDQKVTAIGHRVVHGGTEFCEPVLVDDAVFAQLQKLVPLAPLHQPHNLSGIAAARHAFPKAPQVACFDTSFHRTHPFVSDTFALPRKFYDEGVRRYGFHGLSYEYIARRMKSVAPDLADGRIVVAHLGNGASICAIRGGKSVASTMGFTALDGLPMGTRCGQLDPGVVLYLMAEKGMNAQEISDLLYKESGLRGLSCLSHDMRDLEAAGTELAQEAIGYFVERVRREIGGLAASVGGIDALVFTGGIGENAWKVREAVLSDMGWIGIDLDPAANKLGAERISTPHSRVCAFVVRTDEERMIAEHAADTAGLSGVLTEPRQRAVSATD